MVHLHLQALELLDVQLQAEHRRRVQLQRRQPRQRLDGPEPAWSGQVMLAQHGADLVLGLHAQRQQPLTQLDQ
jgi:hypothetical protein